MLVPLRGIVPFCVQHFAALIHSPGADISGFLLPSLVGPFDEKVENIYGLEHFTEETQTTVLAVPGMVIVVSSET